MPCTPFPLHGHYRSFDPFRVAGSLAHNREHIVNNSVQTSGAIFVVWVRGVTVGGGRDMREDVGHKLGENQKSLPYRYFRFVQCQLLVKGGMGHGTDVNPPCRECDRRKNEKEDTMYSKNLQILMEVNRFAG